MIDFAKTRIVDLSLCLKENYPLTWPGLPIFQKRILNWYQKVEGPHSQPLADSIGGFYDQAMMMDEHIGTHVDYPSHNIPPSKSGLPNAGPAGDAPGETYALENLCGPAAVIDVRSLLDKGEPGVSPLVTPAMIEEWEKKNGKLQPGDVVLLDSGYIDKYFAAFPEGDRVYECVTGKTMPGWPAPSGEAIELVHSRGVRHVGVSTPSIGALPNLGIAHLAGLSRGMSFTEMLINLHQLPARGAYYFAFPLKIGAQSGGPTRAFALVNK